MLSIESNFERIFPFSGFQANTYGVPKLVDFDNKDSLVSFFVRNMLNKTQSMFEYKGLPDTIPQRILKLQIQSNGFTGIIEEKDNLYSVWGGLGGRLDYNYQPTVLTVSNPYLGISKKFNINDDCLIIKNDALYMGLVPVCDYYAKQLAENVISKRMTTINLRAMNVFIAPDDNAKQDCDDFIKDLVKGSLSSILSKSFTKSIETLPYAERAGAQTLTQLIEDQQYIKAGWFNELGLQANYNMKRESINSNESQLNQDALLPFIDVMLETQKEDLEKVNKHFGVHWSVELSSSWKKMRDSIMNPPQESNQLDNKGDSTDKGESNQVDKDKEDEKE